MTPEEYCAWLRGALDMLDTACGLGDELQLIDNMLCKVEIAPEHRGTFFYTETPTSYQKGEENE